MWRNRIWGREHQLELRMITTNHWDDIVSFYDALATNWYKGRQKYIKAELRRIADGCSDSDGYSHAGNFIQLNAPKREIDYPDIEALLANVAADELELSGENSQLIENNGCNCNSTPWPEWQKALVHEAIHEYEKKIIGNAITEAGKRLHEIYKANNFAHPEKHGDSFYTAIADRAEYFGMTAQELRDHL